MNLSQTLARLVFHTDGIVVSLVQSPFWQRIRAILDQTGVLGSLKTSVSRFRQLVETWESYEDKVRRENEYFSAADGDELIAENWEGAPRVKMRLNQLLGARNGEDDDAYFLTWIRERFGSIKGRGLDLACGAGQWPRRLIDAGQGDSFDACDIAEGWIVQAKNNPQNQGYPINFFVADVNNITLPTNTYSVVFVHHSLHHVLKLEHVIEQMSASLRAGGRLILSDYVGPSKMQWTDYQLQEANAFLQLLPDRYLHMGGSGMRRRITRPDPSFLSPFEGVRAGEITPLLSQQPSLRLLDAYWMGSLLPLILTGIARNFSPDDEFANGYIDLVWNAEQLLHRTGALPGNFLIAMYEKV